MIRGVSEIHSNQSECEESASLMGPGVGCTGTQLAFTAALTAAGDVHGDGGHVQYSK